MKRGTFLKRAGLALGGLAVAGKLPPEMLADGAVAAPAAPLAPVAALGSAESLVATGGLCAPLSPYYSLAHVTAASPVRDALPSFSAGRGGLSYTRGPVVAIGRQPEPFDFDDADWDPEGLWDLDD